MNCVIKENIEKVEEKRFILVNKDIKEEKELTEILKAEKIEREKRRKRLNYLNTIHYTKMSTKTSTKVDFYLYCEKCDNTVSASALLGKYKCGEKCGCESVICYECIPCNDRYRKINLDTKIIQIRNPNDLRTNTTTSVYNLDSRSLFYCKNCAVEKLLKGECMIRIKEWEKREIK